MTSKFEVVDRGIGAIQFSELSEQQAKYASYNLFIAQRPGISDRMIYGHFIPEALKSGSSILFPLSQPARITAKHEITYNSEKWNYEPIKPGQIYHFQANKQNSSADILQKFRTSLITKTISHNHVIILIDTIHKLEQPFENQIRHIIHDSKLTNTSLWLYCPLQVVSPDLISSIGNGLVIWPTASELSLLEEQLPLGKPNYDRSELSEGILIFGYGLIGRNEWVLKRFSPK